MADTNKDIPTLKFSHNVIEHLGIKLYRNKSGNVLAELVANSWDADSNRVDISVDPSGGENQNGAIVISDDGHGMSFKHICDQYLHVGKPKRRSPRERSPNGRKPMGRKGLGKLAPFGIARTVDVVSIHDQKITWFTLKLDEILEYGSDGSYPPVFHLKDADVGADTAASSNIFLHDKVAKFCADISSGESKAGTLVCLTDISANLLPTRDEIASELGSRFTVILLKDDFSVYVNDHQISEEDALPKFEFRIPNDGGTVRELVDGNEINYWVGFVAKAEWSADEAGVGVFAHGKIAQTRPYFFNKKGKEVFQRYMYAVIEADWIDDEEDDLISTDRTSIDWSVQRLRPLHDWGQQKVSSWISKYEEHRKAKQDQEITTQAEKLRAARKVNTYSFTENKQIVQLVSDATREIGKMKEAEQTREDLLIAVSKAWINEPTRNFLNALWSKLLDTHATPEQFSEVVKQLSSHSVPEKMGLALTFSQRAFAISVLYELVHQNSETDLQKLVVEFPWILQPRGDLLTADRQLKSTIDKLASDLKEPPGMRVGTLVKSMSDQQRADFVFLTSSNEKTIKVIEIKKPNLQLGKEQERQLVDYLDFISDYRSDCLISGVLIGKKDKFDTDDRRIEVKSWDQIFMECRATYVELLASMLEISDVVGGDSRIEVIKQIGGDKTWDLLSKLAESDENLKSLMDDFEKQKLLEKMDNGLFPE